MRFAFTGARFAQVPSVQLIPHRSFPPPPPETLLNRSRNRPVLDGAACVRGSCHSAGRCVTDVAGCAQLPAGARVAARRSSAAYARGSSATAGRSPRAGGASVRAMVACGGASRAVGETSESVGRATTPVRCKRLQAHLLLHARASPGDGRPVPFVNPVALARGRHRRARGDRDAHRRVGSTSVVGRGPLPRRRSAPCGLRRAGGRGGSTFILTYTTFSCGCRIGRKAGTSSAASKTARSTRTRS